MYLCDVVESRRMVVLRGRVYTVDMDEKTVPSLYEWIGGGPVIERLIGELYRRVPQDPLLAPVFAEMGADHVKHVSAFIAEVFGGPKEYSTRLGGHPHMVRRHLGRSLTEAQRQR